MNRAKMRAYFPSMRCGIDREECDNKLLLFFFSLSRFGAEYSQVRNGSLRADIDKDVTGFAHFVISGIFSTYLYTYKYRQSDHSEFHVETNTQKADDSMQF